MTRCRRPSTKCLTTFDKLVLFLANFGNFKLYHKAKIMISFGDGSRSNVTKKQTNLQMHAFSPTKQLGFYLVPHFIVLIKVFRLC